MQHAELSPKVVCSDMCMEHACYEKCPTRGIVKLIVVISPAHFPAFAVLQMLAEALAVLLPEPNEPRSRPRSILGTGSYDAMRLVHS